MLELFGEEFARQYAEQGHSLVLVARRWTGFKRSPRHCASSSSIEVVVEQVDLSDVEAVLQLHERLGERGIEIDVLVNNAGHGLQGPFVDGPFDAALSMVQLDVASLTAVTHVFVQAMRTRTAREDTARRESVGLPRRRRTSPSMPPPRPTCCAWVRPFIANSSAMASRLGALPGMSDIGFAETGATEDDARVEALDDEAGPRGARAGIRALRAGRSSRSIPLSRRIGRDPKTSDRKT